MQTLPHPDLGTTRLLPAFQRQRRHFPLDRNNIYLFTFCRASLEPGPSSGLSDRVAVLHPFTFCLAPVLVGMSMEHAEL